MAVRLILRLISKLFRAKPKVPKGVAKKAKGKSTAPASKPEPCVQCPPKTTSLADKTAARNALSGEQGVAANRFFRGATSKSRDFKVTDLGNGNKRMEYFSPANNPGYGKRYVQDINSQGQVLREFRETLGPNGLIETKWTHGGP